MSSILLVDDHPVVRQGIARVLSAALPDLQIAEAADVDLALDQLRARPYNLVMLDLSLPGEGGFMLLKRIRQEYPAVPVLVVSMHPVDQFAHRCLQAGAAGYVTKQADPVELMRAVRLTLGGGRYTPAGLEDAERTAQDLQLHASLSDREYQVLRLIGTGRTVSEIGADLGLSVKTVSTYRARILEKLRLRTSAELIHYAVVNQLVP